MAIVSRLEINHPALGTAGGSALHTAIEGIYEKIGDNMADRFFLIEALADSASTDLDHNFNTDLANLRYDVYLVTSVANKELGIRLTKTSTPPITDFGIIAKVGDEKKQITLTNNSGSPRDLAIIMFDDPIELDELTDVDFSTAPEDGQAMVFDQGSGSWKPGASGDSSFKFQKLTGTVLTIKKGFLLLSDGSEIYCAADLSPDLATFIAGADGNYYGYFDRLLFPAYSAVNGRRLIAMTTSQLVFSTTTPDDINLSRYVPIGKVQKATGSFSNIETLAIRRHDVALGVDASLEYTLPLQAISAVGTSGQIAAGHELASASFPSAAIGANLSWYNLADMLDASGNARSLTNNGSATFGTDILGQASKAVSLNGSTQYLSSTDAFFDPGDNDFTCGGWFKPASWIPGATKALFGQYITSGNKRCFAVTSEPTGLLYFRTSIDGGAVSSFYCDASLLTGWHHITAKYIASSNTAYLYIDGKLSVTGVLAAGLYSAGVTRSFNVGNMNNAGFEYDGLIDEFFFAKLALSDNDISKIFASKLSHNRTLSPVSQKWLMTGISADDQARELLDNIVDMDVNDLYFDLSDEISTTEVELKLYNRSSTGLSKASKPRTLEMTVDDLDALLPITHGLGVVPEMSFKVKVGSDYEYHDHGSIFLANTTQIKLAGDDLVTIYGTGVICILTYATASVSQFVPNKFWNTYVASGAQAILANDKVLADTTSGAFALTLPGNPALGWTLKIADYEGTWSETNYVTLNPSGSDTIMGAASLELKTANDYVELTYNGNGDWRITG